MKTPLIRRAISVRPSSIHGYGVFADEPFKAGEIIEECYALELPDLFVFSDYSVQWKENCTVLPLGYGAIYNHSKKPSIQIERDPARHCLIFRALRNILQDEELFIYYGDNWFSSRAKTDLQPASNG